MASTSLCFEKQSQSASRQFLAPFLLAIFVIWQAAYQFYLHRVADNDLDDSGSDGACSVLPGTNGYSTLCMEAHLFKGWDEIPADSPAELESLLEISPKQGKQDAIAASPTTSDAPRALRSNVKRALAEDSDKSRVPSEAPQKQSAFMAKSTEAKGKHIFSTKGLTELQKELDAKMQQQARRHAEHKAMRALHSIAAQGESTEASTTTRELTPWAQGLVHDMHDIEEHMNHWREERSDHAAAFASAFTAFAASHKEHRAEKAHEAERMTAQKAKQKTGFEAASNDATKADDTSPLLHDIETLGSQLCQDPKRRHTSACAHFSESHLKASNLHAAHNHLKADADAHKRLLEKHMQQLHKDQEHDDEGMRKQSDKFLRELCADPSRKSYPACAHLEATTTALPRSNSNLRAGAKSSQKRDVESTTSAPARPRSNLRATATSSQVQHSPKSVGHPVALQWSPLTDSEVNLQHHHAGEAVLTMERKQLLGHRWEGRIPKIACISVLPEGKVTEVLMKYFMDNYKLQNYEGSRELVLVYHNTDAEAARIAHLYADGISVKAAAARDFDTYPSATAYRYGAWIAKDADIVTRWDFEGFHHPNRLSMQVHAIALSKRPVSLLSGVTAFDTDGKHTVVSNTGPYHGSMMGDAAWMRKNWMPVLEEENSVLRGLHSADVTKVAMPELLSYHDASMFKQ